MGVMRATFVGADLSGADLSDANLFKADPLPCQPHQRKTGPNQSHERGPDPDRSDHRADLTGAKLAKANIDEADYTPRWGSARSRDWIRPATGKSELRCEMMPTQRVALIALSGGRQYSSAGCKERPALGGGGYGGRDGRSPSHIRRGAGLCHQRGFPESDRHRHTY